MWRTGDTTYNFVLVGIWANIGLTLENVCGCMPILPKFFQVVEPKVSSGFALTRHTPESLSLSLSLTATPPGIDHFIDNETANPDQREKNP